MAKRAFEQFYNAAAGGYDQNFGRISAEFIPALLSAGRVGPGQKVLDIATGTGIAAEAAAEITGPELDFPPAII
jgi:ubiquinone/menaquinone biosynthesis C-methylase UbiE